MGMAASQARLLTLTARIHDVEFRAQSLQNAKLQLATQSDEVYREYLEALDATTLTVKDMEGKRVTANFNNLCSENAITSKHNTQYFIYDKRGRVVATPEVKEGYDNFKGLSKMGDAYAFAMYMMGKKYNYTYELMSNSFQQDVNNENIAEDKFLDHIYGSIEEVKNSKDWQDELARNQNIVDLYNSMVEIMQDAGIIENDGRYIHADDERKLKENHPADYEKYVKAKAHYEQALYTVYAPNIFIEATNSKLEEASNTELNDYDTDEFRNEFQYYVNVFNEIEAAGGCVSIDDYNDFEKVGDVAKDSDWLQSMIQSGSFTIAMIYYDTKGKPVNEVDGVSSSTYLEHTSTPEIDQTALAKAEAQYEHDTKMIDNKEKQFDLDISKLETERKALTTEYESVKKVIQENIDRTFGIFS